MRPITFNPFKRGPLALFSFILALTLLTSLSGKKTLPPPSCANTTWGFYGHKKINEMAIYTLPEEMFGFYKANMEFMIEHSVDPDKRRYGVKGEAECHYIDMDHYCFDTTGCDPFVNVPKRWTDAVAQFGEDSLREHGIVPWNVNNVLNRLTEAMKKNDMTRILRLSAELGHYIGDAHVPLHSTSNYNGQKTNQRGIHGFWESRLPEIYEPQYDFFVGKAQYVEAPLNFIWDRVRESYAAVDSVLSFEARLSSEFPNDLKYSFEARGVTQTKVYSREYSSAYNKMLNDQVERRMKRAVLSVGSYWYTAWINAGQPDLGRFINEKPDASELEEMQKEIDAAPNSDIKAREHDGSSGLGN